MNTAMNTNAFTQEFFDFLVNDTTETAEDEMALDLALTEAFATDLVETNIADDDLDMELEKALEAAMDVVEPVPVVDMELLNQISIPAARMRDPSDPCAHMFEKKPKVVAEGEVVKTDRRNENHKAPTRVLLNASDRKRYSTSMYVDKMVVPTVELYGEERLTTSKISAELERDFRGLSTIVVTRATLASAVSFGSTRHLEPSFPRGPRTPSVSRALATWSVTSSRSSARPALPLPQVLAPSQRSP